MASLNVAYEENLIVTTWPNNFHNVNLTGPEWARLGLRYKIGEVALEKGLEVSKGARLNGNRRED